VKTIPERWFNQLGETQRGTRTQDSGGGWVHSYTTNLTNVPMRLNVPSGSWDDKRDCTNAQLVVKIYVPCNPTPDIKEKDRVILCGDVYDVSAIRDTDGAGVFLTLDATKVSPAKAVT
jgi:hypothetical protein